MKISRKELDLDHPALTEIALRAQNPRPGTYSVRSKNIHPEGSYTKRLRERLREARRDDEILGRNE